MIIEINNLKRIGNPERVKYVIPSGFCYAGLYIFYNNINPSDLNNAEISFRFDKLTK